LTSEDTREALVRFYDALARRDGETLSTMYADTATFRDPVFHLQGKQIGLMWIGLMRRAKDFAVSYTIAQAGPGRGLVEWTARYLFGGRRPVVNVILSEIEFEDGRIVRQTDRFDFRRWSAQAFGTPGKLFGRFGWFQRVVSRRAAGGLRLSSSAD